MVEWLAGGGAGLFFGALAYLGMLLLFSDATPRRFRVSRFAARVGAAVLILSPVIVGAFLAEVLPQGDYVGFLVLLALVPVGMCGFAVVRATNSDTAADVEPGTFFLVDVTVRHDRKASSARYILRANSTEDAAERAAARLYQRMAATEWQDLQEQDDFEPRYEAEVVQGDARSGPFPHGVTSVVTSPRG